MKNKNYPYPVLRKGYDDILPMLEDDNAVINSEIIENKYFRFTITLTQFDPEITKLINDSKAEYAVEIWCQSTLFRRMYRGKSHIFSICINRKDLHKQIVIQPYVIAKEDIVYQNPQAHPDYAGFTFPIKEGDPLVVFDTITGIADIDYEKLSSFQSIILPRRIEDSTAKYITYEALDTEDYVYVNMPAKLHDDWLECNNSENMHFFHSSIIYNALLYTLYNTSWDFELSADGIASWKYAIKYLIANTKSTSKYAEDLDAEAENYPEIAQKLLNMPIFNLIQSLASPEDENKYEDNNEE